VPPTPPPLAPPAPPRHTPPVQVWPPEQGCVQEPQLALSVCVLTQPEVQVVVPAGHMDTHCEFEQKGAVFAGQVVPQAPQFALSLLRLMQACPQRLCPAAQPQVPLLRHTWVAEQTGHWTPAPATAPVPAPGLPLPAPGCPVPFPEPPPPLIGPPPELVEQLMASRDERTIVSSAPTSCSRKAREFGKNRFHIGGTHHFETLRSQRHLGITRLVSRTAHIVARLRTTGSAQKSPLSLKLCAARPVFWRGAEMEEASHLPNRPNACSTSKCASPGASQRGGFATRRASRGRKKRIGRIGRSDGLRVGSVVLRGVNLLYSNRLNDFAH
jgi:hypothetical protein